VVTWATGYLGWLPATGLMPPVTKQQRPQVMMPILHHIVFGIAAVGGLHGLRLALGARSSTQR